MSTTAVRGLASIIIPCWNQLEFTRQCIRALMRQTGPNWELVVVNNGSTDGTSDYLAGVQDTSPVPVTVIANATNRGFPTAVNQGLQYARGEYLVMLNNDVVVTEGWLDHLVALSNVQTDFTTEGGTKRAEGTIAGSSTTENTEHTEVQGVRTLITAKNAKSAKNAERQDGTGLSTTENTESTEIQEDRTLFTAKNAKSAKENADKQGTAGGVVADDAMIAADLIESGPEIEKSRSKVGLVGPMSNYAAPPQLVPDVGYQRLDEMPAFARWWREQHRGKWFTVPKLSGFCLLMKRAVYDAIGGLDERFGLGFFDDDDLAERARRAGFELAVAHDLFVHHFGSRTFVGNGIDANRLLDENAAKFSAKWGNSVPQGRRVALRPFSGHAQGQHEWAVDSTPGPRTAENSESDGARRNLADRAGVPLSPAERARVSLTMIVRDEEQNLPHCLESVRGLFDEVVVLDTGSKDRTIEIAKSFGARVFDFVWVDDFAAARNAALARATGDYAFWLDADDLVEPPERKKLERLLRRLPRAQQSPAFVVRCACDPGPDGSGGDTVVDHIRLFPLIEGVRWSYRVHEQILPALKRAGVATQWTDITVRHTGYADKALRSRKLDRDSRILHEELAERPDDPFTLFNLGSIAIERGQWNEALEYLKRSLAGSAPTDSITRKLFALIARAHQMLGDLPSALKCCAEGLSLDCEDAELWFRKAVVQRHSGEPAAAEQSWRRILTLSRPQKFASIDHGIYGHLTRRNLAVLAKARGDHEEAARQWRAVLAECPGDKEAMSHLT